MSFVHLHNHSIYSLLDGYSDVSKMVARARALDMPAMALTDHGTMFGVIEFFRAAKAEGIKPIIGVEAYMARRSMQDRDAKLDTKPYHMLLLAKNMTGYQNLLKIASASQLDGFYYKPRIDHDFLAAHAEGLIGTTGCMAAEVPRMVDQGQHEAARKALDYYYDTFGPENFFIELQDHNIPELDDINKALIALGPRYQARYLATNDTHYVMREDHVPHDALLCVQTGSKLGDAKRMKMDGDSYYIRTPDEMHRLFGHVPGAIENTLLVAEMCDVDLESKDYKLPAFDVPPGYDAQSYLRHLCERGLVERFGEEGAQRPEIRERLEYELGIIHTMGFDAYFLIVWDLCMHAAKKGIWYNARGSAAGSLVAYALRVTLVDPIHHGLIFERFLNPGRVSMPDVDLDFQDDRRAEMLEYCANKYGEENVAQIITFGKMKARAALRDVGRVMGIDLDRVNQVTRMVPEGPKVKLGPTLEDVPEFKQVYENDPEIRQMIDMALKLEGVVRNAGTHAAGLLITPEPVINYVPLHRPTSGADDSVIKTVAQFPMEIVESLGLLKVDFLGLRTLSIMARACDLIRERHGKDYTIDNIPTDDPEIFKLLGRGEVDGVFQVESSGMRRYLMEMKPQKLDHVTAMVALYRPGPLEFIPSYIRRMHGKEEVSYIHPALEPMLAETFGITVYQEQVMYTAINLAGYTASEADFLRKAIAKKKEKQLLEHRVKFTEGAIANGIPAETAEAIFKNWEAFARYGFPKGHAADYAVITCQTAYLKAHYPHEYMTALLSAEKADTAKVAQYVADTQRMQIEVLPPSVSHSGWDFTIEDRDDGTTAIRFGMGAIKNVGEASVEIIRAEQLASGPFRSLDEFCTRVDLRKVGKRALEFLIKAGALDGFDDRGTLINGIDQIMGASAHHHQAQDVGQFDMFSMLGGRAGVQVQLSTGGEPISKRQLKRWEREVAGLYVTGHPLLDKWDLLRNQISLTALELTEHWYGKRVAIAGSIVNIKPHLTRKSEPMAFIDLEDITGLWSMVVFPKVWKQVRETVEVDQLVMVRGSIDDQGKVLVDEILTNPTVVTIAEPAPGWALDDAARVEAELRAADAPLGGFDELDAADAYDDDDDDDAPATPVAALDVTPDKPTPRRANGVGTAQPAGPARSSRPAKPPAEPDPPMPDWDDAPPPFEHDDLASESVVMGWPALDVEADDLDDEGDPIAPESETYGAVVEAALPAAPADDDDPFDLQPVRRVADAPAAPYVPGEAAREAGAKPATAKDSPTTKDQNDRKSLPDVGPGDPRHGRSPMGRPGLLPERRAGPPKKIMLVLNPTNDLFESYKLRLQWAVRTLRSFPGNDRFSVLVQEADGRKYELDFMETTGYCDDLEKHLLEIVHTSDNIIVQPLLMGD